MRAEPCRKDANYMTLATRNERRAEQLAGEDPAPPAPAQLQMRAEYGTGTDTARTGRR